MKIIKETYQTAKKDYECNASLIIRECYSFRDLTFSEKREVVRARENNWKIKKGEKYLYQFIEDDGYIFTYKSIPEIHEICCKYDYYTDR